MTTSAQTPPDAASPQVPQANDRKPGNRNTLVIAVVLVALGLMAWAGIKNYQRRKQEEAKLKELQSMVVKLPPPDGLTAAAPPATPPGDDAPSANPLAGKSAPNFTLKDTAGKKNEAKATDAWFVGYAPVGDPKVVVAALFPNQGYGADTAAPAVRQVIEDVLGVS